MNSETADRPCKRIRWGIYWGARRAGDTCPNISR